jgi:predicted RNase H-like nuclease (RuvC/YqgF family)
MDYNRDIMTHEEEVSMLHSSINHYKKKMEKMKEEYIILKSANSSMAKENIKLREKINQK